MRQKRRYVSETVRRRIDAEERALKIEYRIDRGETHFPSEEMIILMLSAFRPDQGLGHHIHPKQTDQNG